MEKIAKEELVTVLDSVLKSMEGAKEELIELDGSMGDGDLGLTMVKGFEALCADLREQTETDMGKLMMKLGMKMNATVPSTMGTLVSTCFMKAGPAAKNKTEIDLSDMVAMGQGAVKGVMERGKTKIGDKTMLDALAPAVDALASASSAGKSLTEAWQDAAAAAEQGVEATKSMQSVHGRAAYYREKSVGRQDPGATAVMYIVRGIAEGIKQL